MKIAIVGKFDFHLECAGFLLEMYKDNVDIYITPGTNKFNYPSGGVRVKAQEGGLMNLGGMEKDYRAEGGFVPIG